MKKLSGILLTFWLTLALSGVAVTVTMLTTDIELTPAERVVAEEQRAIENKARAMEEQRKQTEKEEQEFIQDQAAEKRAEELRQEELNKKQQDGTAERSELSPSEQIIFDIEQNHEEYVKYDFDPILAGYGTTNNTAEESIEQIHKWVTAQNAHIKDYATFRIIIGLQATYLTSLTGKTVTFDAPTNPNPNGKSTKVLVSDETTQCKVNLPSFEKTCSTLPEGQTP